MEDYDIEKEKKISFDFEEESLGDSFAYFNKQCYHCREWTDQLDAELCWRCGGKYHK